MSKLIQNTFYYGLGSFTSKALNFLLLPIYTSYLSPDEFGIVNSMQVFSNILIIFFTFGLERSIYRLFFDYKTEADKKNFLGTIAIAILVISAIVCAVIFILNHQIEKIYTSISFYPFYSYAILTSVFSTFELVPTISLQVKEKAKEYLGISLLLMTTKILPVIWFVVFEREGAVGMLKGALIGNIVALSFLLPITFKQINICFKTSILFNTLKYCLPIIPSIVSFWVVNLSDRIFIERYFSTYDVGIYSLGYKIGQLVQFVSAALLMAYNPFFYKLANSKDQITAKIKLYKINNASVIVMLIIGFFVSLFAKDIIVLFFDEKYLETYKIIPIIALGCFFIQLISLQSLSFHQEKKTIAIMNINIVAAFLNIIFNFLLISKYGYLGAAISTVITQFIFFLIYYSYSRRYYFIPYNWGILIPLLLILSFIVVLNIILIPVSLIVFVSKIVFILFALIFYYIFFFKKLELKFQGDTYL